MQNKESFRVDYLLLCLIILLYPINIKLFLSFRPLDIVCLSLIAYALVQNSKKRTIVVQLSFLFFWIFTLSLIAGILFIGIVRIENLFFTYKYLFPFLLFYALSTIEISNDGIQKLIKYYKYSFLFMILYIYIYLLLVSTGILSSHYRVSFPFSFLSTGDDVSDSPLYSAYLANSFLFYYYLVKRKIINEKKLVIIIIFILWVIAIILTGSRTGIVSFFFIFLMFNFLIFMTRIARSKYRIKTTINKEKFIAILVVLISIIALVILLDDYFQDNELVTKLIKRAFEFNFSDDASSQSRIRKTGIALDLISENFLVLGTGMVSINMDWFDSSIGTILANSGLLGLFFFILVLFFFMYLLRFNSNFYGVLLVFIHYIFSNLISEYFLVTRSVVPFMLIIFLLIKSGYDTRKGGEVEGKTRYVR